MARFWDFIPPALAAARMVACVKAVAPPMTRSLNSEAKQTTAAVKIEDLCVRAILSAWIRGMMEF
jgi:hypothetical protein